MAGSKGVQTRSEASKGGGVKTRGGGVKTRGGRCGGGGRSNGGRSSGGVERSTGMGNLVISAPGGSNNRSSIDSRAKGVAAESGGKGKAVAVGESSSHRDDGDGTPLAPKATRRPSSSQSSNPSGQLSRAIYLCLEPFLSSIQLLHAGLNLYPVFDNSFRFRIMLRKKKKKNQKTRRRRMMMMSNLMTSNLRKKMVMICMLLMAKT